MHRALTCLALFVGPVAEAAETVTYLHSDVQGSPVAATDEAGVVLWREAYLPYGGRILDEAAAADQATTYTGHVEDRETGLVYAVGRYYDPEIGRFMGIDPAGIVATDPVSFNRYAYANDNPYTFVDPDGLAAEISVINGGLLSKQGVVYIRIPITYYGVPPAVQERWNKGIEKRWTGNFGPYRVITHVVPSSNRSTGDPNENTVSLLRKECSRSCVRYSVEGFWRGNASGEVAAHEAGHLLGLPDQYDDIKDHNGNTIRTVPQKGWENNIMATSGKPVDERNIKAIVDNQGKIDRRRVRDTE